MKRRLAAALLIAMLPLGLAACNNTKSNNASNDTAAPSASASTEPTQSGTPTQDPTTSSQSIDEACAIISNDMSSFIGSFNDMTDEAEKKAAVNSAIKTLTSPQITNPEVKQASSNVASVLTEALAYGEKYDANPDAADPSEASDLISRLGNSLVSLGNLCPSLQ